LAKSLHFTGPSLKAPVVHKVFVISARWSRPLAQPRASFAGTDLHASLHAKAAALGFSLALNHPFIDGNKRVAHGAMETFLILNGSELVATVDDQERLMLDLAAGTVTREQLTEWIEKHLQPAR
jgi:death-on-curing protein